MKFPSKNKKGTLNEAPFITPELHKVFRKKKMLWNKFCKK